MKSTFTDCDFSNNGIDGARLSKNSSVEFENTITNNNGRNGVTLGSGSDATFKKHQANNNGEYGVAEVDTNILGELGLPEDTDIDELKKLLLELIKADNERKATVVRSSFLADFLGKSANSTTIIANLILFAQTLNFLPK